MAAERRARTSLMIAASVDGPGPYHGFSAIGKGCERQDRRELALPEAALGAVGGGEREHGRYRLAIAVRIGRGAAGGQAECRIERERRATGDRRRTGVSSAPPTIAASALSIRKPAKSCGRRKLGKVANANPMTYQAQEREAVRGHHGNGFADGFCACRNMTHPFRYYLRVRYGECDAQRVVFNPRWADYVDIGCTEFFRALGFAEALASGALDYQVVKLTLEWKAPARIDQVLELSIYTTKLGNTSFTVVTEFRIAGRGPHLQGRKYLRERRFKDAHEVAALRRGPRRFGSWRARKNSGSRKLGVANGRNCRQKIRLSWCLRKLAIGRAG